jgi:hypothetical protein
VKPGVAFDLAPDGLGEDVISLVLAVPFFVVFAVLVPLWAVELAARLVATPVAVALRLAGVLPYQLTLYRGGVRHAGYRATGRAELVALRTGLVARPSRPAPATR